VRETKRADLRVDEPEGERWQLAMDLLEDSLKMVQVHDLLLYRDRGRPPVPPVVVVEVDAWDWLQPSLDRSYSETRGKAQVAEARARIARLVAIDERFAALVSRFGVRYELVVDYGNGAVRVAEVDEDGELTWKIPGWGSS
jgi:hypothetical protein